MSPPIPTTSLRHRLSRFLRGVAGHLDRLPAVRALGRRVWDLYWEIHLRLRCRLAGRLQQVPTRVGPMWVDLMDRGIGRHLLWYGSYEPLESELLARLLRPGMTALDLGANIGYHTALLARGVGAAGTVVAVEPVAANFHLLERNAQRLEVGSLHLLNVALGARAGEVRLELHPTNFGMHRLTGDPAAEDGASAAIPMTTLDRVVAELDVAPDLIKVDVEGAEGQILAGATRTLGDNPDLLLLVEINPPALARAGTPAGELLETLRRLGFRAYRLRAAGGEAGGAMAEEAPEAWLQAVSLGTDHVNLLFSRRPPSLAPAPPASG